MDMHLHLKGADMVPRCVWVLVLTYHLTLLCEQRHTFHLALVCTLFTSWQTPRHLLINHAKHSGEPLFQWWALFQSNSFGPSISQSPSQGVTWKTAGRSPTRSWKGLSRDFSGSERNFFFSELQPPELGAFCEHHHPIEFRWGLFDSPIPNYLRPVTQTSLLHPGKPQRHWILFRCAPYTLRAFSA